MAFRLDLLEAVADQVELQRLEQLGLLFGRETLRPLYLATGEKL